uniref:Uncharacterized protein n=1 Tax=Rhizophora mucronata TaxID=61149 RepID=A0A2P2PH10_RHIMU
MFMFSNLFMNAFCIFPFSFHLVYECYSCLFPGLMSLKMLS